MPSPIESSMSELLFGDFTESQRVSLLKDNYEMVAKRFGSVATPDVVDLINDNCEVQAVFNYHGDDTDALRTVNAIWAPGDPESKKPFITFMEGVHNVDVHQEISFQYSVNSAFGLAFDGVKPNIGIYYPDQQLASGKAPWQYWRDRGLIERGSILVPIDLRKYSAQYVETLIGAQYNPEFLSDRPSLYNLRNNSFEDMFKAARNHGMKIHYSNGLREYASAAQIVGVLSRVLGHKEAQLQLTEDQQRKLDALRQERLKNDDPLPISIIYGTAHHAMVHILRNAGIQIDRNIADKKDGPHKFTGSVMDQFFASHFFGLRPIDVDKYARQMLISHMLQTPLYEPAEFGTVIDAKDRSEFIDIYNKISKLARSEDLADNIEDFFVQFQQNPNIVVGMLQKAGIPITAI